MSRGLIFYLIFCAIAITTMIWAEFLTRSSKSGLAPKPKRAVV